jgi:hypothetical protein
VWFLNNNCFWLYFGFTVEETSPQYTMTAFLMQQPASRRSSVAKHILQLQLPLFSILLRHLIERLVGCRFHDSTESGNKRVETLMWSPSVCTLAGLQQLLVCAVRTTIVLAARPDPSILHSSYHVQIFDSENHIQNISVTYIDSPTHATACMGPPISPSL